MGLPPEQVILFIIGTIVILFGAYYVTYFIGMKASGQTRGGPKTRNINLIDRYAIARDKQFCILEVAGKVYIIGITNHTMTLLDTIDAAAFAKLTENNDEATPWGMTPVGQYGNKLTRKVVAFIAEKMGKKEKDTENEEQETENEAQDTKNEEQGTWVQSFADSLKEAQNNAGSTTDKAEPSENPENPEED